MFVKLWPYRMNTKRVRRYQKLSPQYFGQFNIVSHAGQLGYCLKIPDDVSINPVFHVSKFTKHKGDNPEPRPLPSTLDNQLRVTMVLEHVLGTLQTFVGTEVLIRWKHMLVEDTTWGTATEVNQCYHDFHLADLVAATGGGDISSVRSSTVDGRAHIQMLPEQPSC